MEIYKNTILRPQVKLEHDGLTAQFLIGNFTSGLFRTTDSAVTLSTPGELILYHANVPHLSEQFSGTRYAIVCSFHHKHADLATSVKARLRSLGFGLDTTLDNLPVKDVADTTTIDPLTVAPGDSVHMVPPKPSALAMEPGILTPRVPMQPVRKQLVKDH